MKFQPHVLIALGNAGTEQSWEIPGGAKQVTIQNREGDTGIIYYFSSTAGSPTGNAYFTLPAGYTKLFTAPFDGQTMYFQAVTNNGKNLEIEYAI